VSEALELGNKLKTFSKLDDALAIIRAVDLDVCDSGSLTRLLRDVDGTVFDPVGKASLKREILRKSKFPNFDSRGTLADVFCFKNLDIEVVELENPITLYRRGYPGEPIAPNGLGRWWGDKYRTIDEVRNELAVCEGWGNPLTGEYQITVPKGTKVLKGTAAPQSITDAAGTVVEYRVGDGIQYWLNDVPSEWLH